MVPSVCTIQTRVDALAVSVAEAEAKVVGHIGNGGLTLAETFIIDPLVKADSKVFLSRRPTGSVSGHLSYEIVPDTGVAVFSSAPADFSPFSYQIIH